MHLAIWTGLCLLPPVPDTPLPGMGEVLAIANKGRQCLLSLVGEAGSGKSRLLSETMRRLRLGGHDVGMHVCRVPPASKDVPLATAQAPAIH